MATDRDDADGLSGRDGNGMESGGDESAAAGRDGLLWDAGYGALVMLALSIVPFSPVAGGAASGFRSDGGSLVASRSGCSPASSLRSRSQFCSSLRSE